MEALAVPTVEWGAAIAAMPGESSCGDAFLAKTVPQGLLAAAIDGIGHGAEAASAAAMARAVLDAHAREPLLDLVGRCHEALRGTRGVAMSLASIDLGGPRLTWLGVGNVQGMVLRRGAPLEPDEILLLRAGVVGSQLPPVREAVIRLSPRDTLVLATDGLASELDRDLARSLSPQAAAEALLARHRRGTDDALVLVARVVGGSR